MNSCACINTLSFDKFGQYNDALFQRGVSAELDTSIQKKQDSKADAKKTKSKKDSKVVDADFEDVTEKKDKNDTDKNDTDKKEKSA